MAESQRQLTARTLFMHLKAGLTNMYPEKKTFMFGSIRSGVRYTCTTLHGYIRLTKEHFFCNIFTACGCEYSYESRKRLGWTCVIATTGLHPGTIQKRFKPTHRKYIAPPRLISRSILTRNPVNAEVTEVLYYIPPRAGGDARDRS